MGLDFIEKRKSSIQKSWDRARVKLCTGDLLTRTAEHGGCSAAFDIEQNSTLHEGECVTVEVEGVSLVARRGLSVVARAPRPPDRVVKAIRDSCGVARGTVDHVHDAASVAEILVC